MRFWRVVFFLLVLGFVFESGPGRPAEGRQPANDAYWIESMKKVHAKFTGRKGTFAHFGDSITVTMAFWTPLLYKRTNASPQMEAAFQLVNSYMQKECWRNWKGAEYGNTGMMTIRWAYDNVDKWLKKLNPEVALIMFGTNDLSSLGLDEYQAKTRVVVQKCLDNGTVVILSTIPPRHGAAEKAAVFADAVRKIAGDMKVPLTDFHAEILKRRPDDWDGALEKFKDYKGYDVPTLISRDGVHPGHPKAFRDDYSDEALRQCGFSLRNYLVLLKYAEVLRALGLASAPPPAPAPQPPRQKQTGALQAPVQPWFPKAPPLSPATGDVIEVSSVDELFAAAERVKPGGTILLGDGHYMMPRYFEIHTDRVTLRSASGKREHVVLDGARSRHGELVGISRCSGVTLADLTIQNIRHNGFKINSNTNVQNLTIYNCIIHNIWQRGVKGVRVPEADRDQMRPKNCRIQYCLFYNDRPKRFTDDPADRPDNFNGNYVGGIDVMYAKNWIISDNVFTGIRGRTGEARGAVFIWHDSQDCIVERNIIIDCDTGICLGNSSRGAGTKIHCTRCIVRNNFVTRAPENGILADYTQDCKILHNTVYDPRSRLRRLIRLVHDNDGLLVANNLLSGPPMRIESQSRITFQNNLEKDVTGWLADPQAGDLHLTREAGGAIDRAAPVAGFDEDIDGEARGQRPDIGADERATATARRRGFATG